MYRRVASTLDGRVCVGCSTTLNPRNNAVSLAPTSAKTGGFAGGTLHQFPLDLTVTERRRFFLSVSLLSIVRFAWYWGPNSICYLFVSVKFTLETEKYFKFADTRTSPSPVPLTIKYSSQFRRSVSHSGVAKIKLKWRTQTKHKRLISRVEWEKISVHCSDGSFF